ncbi:unnamed protein product [Owenia fusiformis]|uniref:Deacetylase sirtuin-type domain-containing protein n=1 Tax=Owenia fusiformis TaxID=6347 RepID=A0A8J1XWU0_OWEFU|nr:unnamed protein product [Owenia fusiformis]
MTAQLAKKLAKIKIEMDEDFACKFSLCKDRKLTIDDARVEVKSFQALDKHGFLINWSDEGEAIFHYKCWELIVDSVKGKRSTSFHLNDTEKDMIHEAWKTAEYHDSTEHLKQKAYQIARIILDSKYMIAFTGAGISTAAGIGDFRGKSGKWTEQDRSKTYGAKAKPSRSKRNFIYEELRPTYTHEALAKLIEMGHIKYLISQNCDGLHRLSGVPFDSLAELHGNAYHERCEDCTARYERSHAIRTVQGGNALKKCSTCGHCHRSGKKCEQPGCNGYLMNTIINFGDNLESEVLDKAIYNAKKGDAVLCLGTTLRVSPANSLVEMGKQPARIIICNRQSTPCDALCSNRDSKDRRLGARVYGDCDALMSEVMKYMLPPNELEEWENARVDRMKVYDSRRK